MFVSVGTASERMFFTTARPLVRQREVLPREYGSVRAEAGSGTGNWLVAAKRS